MDAKAQVVTIDWVMKSQVNSLQCHVFEPVGIPAGAIEPISQDRMRDRRQVGTNLMRAACVWLSLDQCEVQASFFASEIRVG